MRGSVEFVVTTMRATPNWAFVQVEPQRPGGGAIDLAQTGFRDDADMMDGSTVFALVSFQGGRWNLVDHVVGPTDVAYAGWSERYGVPARLLGLEGNLMLVLPKGIKHIPGFLDRGRQEEIVEAIRGVVAEAPLFVPEMPKTGKPMSVRMTNCGPLGWVTDREKGYRYQPLHPATGRPWPPMPDVLLEIWNAVSASEKQPEACLVNFYSEEARMGLHQDRDERDLETAVVSISLGDSCLFRVGGKERGGQTVSFRLESGDIVILGGEGRLAFHGVDRIYPDTSTLLKNGGRLNLTLRRVNP